MRVAGFGFRATTTEAALAAALAAAGGAEGLAALATAADKAAHPALARLAARLSLPLSPVPLAEVAAAPAGRSPRAPTRYGGKSLAEAAALAAAGPGARLLAARAVSPDRTATCAIAQGRDPDGVRSGRALPGSAASENTNLSDPTVKSPTSTNDGQAPVVDIPISESDAP